ncbi:T9SS type A sorting domain-containing protein [Flavobacterium sp.]
MKKNVLLFATLLASFGLHAQPGILDPTFSEDGKLNVIMDGRGRATSVLVQPDAKIVVGGYSREGNGRNDFALARFGSDGQLDRTFNGTGKAYFDTANNNDYYCTGTALQTDGKIVAAGFMNTVNGFDFAVVRFNANGTVDPTFGINGITTGHPGVTSFCDGVTIQPDGKIILIGHTLSSVAASNEFVAMRFLPNGQTDNSFGNNGTVTTTTGVGSTIATSIIIQPDGKIILAGHTANNTTFRWETILVRYHANGSLDDSFGQNGMVITALPVLDCTITALALQPDGNIVAAGYTGTGPSGNQILVIRYDSAGQLDPSFANNGILIATPGVGSNTEVSSLLLTNSKIILGGSVNVSNGEHSFLTCLNANGTIDTSFGTNGTTVSVFGEHDSISSLAIQPDGKIVSAGGALINNSLEFTVARFIASPSLGIDDRPETPYRLTAYPNPLTPGSQLRFTLDHSTNVSIEIYDALGRKVNSIYNGNQDAGQHELLLDFAAELPKGAYHLVFSAEAGSTSLKLLK